MRFALMDKGAQQGSAAETGLELVLANGERLRIGAGVNATTLPMVLEVVRG